jgi:transcription elongation factor Elf1
MKQIEKAVSMSAHGWLECPVCGFDYLHQGQVKAEHDHVSISFSCEGCPSVLALVIRQHKGNTYLEWFHDPIQEKLQKEELQKQDEQAEILTGFYYETKDEREKMHADLNAFLDKTVEATFRRAQAGCDALRSRRHESNQSVPGTTP